MEADVSHTAELKDYLTFAIDLARKAGEYMVSLEGFNEPLPKGHIYINEYVADVIEEYIQNRIAQTYPAHALFTGLSDKEVEYEWICDYIDGAYAYSKKHRISVTSVALVHRGITIVAAVYNPWTDTLYHATLGGGFHVNGQRHQVVQSESYKGSLIDVEWWRNASYDVDTWLHQFSVKNDTYVLHIGSIIHAACLVANNTFSAAVLGKFMSGKNHEIAAIKLLIEEAGCVLTDLHGNSITNVGDIEGLVFSNKSVHTDLIESYAQFAN